MSTQPTHKTSGSGETPQFEHTALTHPDEIRLVRILPGHLGTPVQCRLQHVRLGKIEHTPYTAISYVWGSQRSRIPLECSEDGASLQVTKNCYTVLSGLRDSSCPSLLWIDAVCIDQERNDERNQQVLLMNRIYKTAAKVTIFLGTGSVSITKLLHRIRDSTDQVHRLCRTPHGKEVLLQDVSLSILASWTSEDTRLMKLFLGHPYWRRMWTVQEARAAGRLEVIFNQATYDNSLLRRIVWIRTAFLDTEFWFPLSCIVWMSMPTSKWHWDFWTLLTFTRTFGTSDLRDRIIALLGLADDLHESLKELLADYNRGSDCLFQRVVMFYFFEVVGLRPCHLFLNTKSLGRLLDSSQLEDATDEDHEQRHVLRTIAGELSTSAHGCATAETLQILATSIIHTQAEFECLWSQCHNFFHPHMEFAQAIQFGDVVRATRDTKCTPNSTIHSAYSSDDGDTTRFALAVTINGQLIAVDKSACTGDLIEPLDRPVTFGSEWLLHDGSSSERPTVQSESDPGFGIHLSDPDFEAQEPVAAR